MQIEDGLATLLLWGALLGSLGQGVRILVGLKKKMTQGIEAEPFNTIRLLLSLAIGGCVGAVAIVAIADNNSQITRSLILAVLAAGYAGADSIEGLLRQRTGSTGPAARPAPGP